MPRPVGVSILAVLSFLVGAFYLIAGIGFLSSAPWTHNASVQTGLTPRYGWLFLLIGLVDLAAAYGLWTLRRWGWSLMVVLIYDQPGSRARHSFCRHTAGRPHP